jgi:hypothetical protein
VLRTNDLDFAYAMQAGSDRFRCMEPRERNASGAGRGRPVHRTAISEANAGSDLAARHKTAVIMLEGEKTGFPTRIADFRRCLRARRILRRAT